MRTVLVNVFRVAITVAILWWLIRRIDIGLVWDQVRGTNLFWLAAAFALSLTQRVMRSLTWGQLLLAKGVRLPRLQLRLLQLYFAGGFLGALFPSSVTADAIRMVLAKRLLGENMGMLAATALLLNAITWVAACVVGFSGLALLLLQGEHSRELSRVAMAFLIISAGLALAYSLLSAFQSTLMASMRGWRLPFYRIRQFLRRLLSALVLNGVAPGTARKAVACVIVSQLLGVLSLAAIGKALGMAVPAAAYLVAIPLSGVATLLPASVLGFGAVQLVHVIFFRSFGASDTTALAVSALYAVKGVGIYILIGAVVLLFSDLSRSEAVGSRHNTPPGFPSHR